MQTENLNPIVLRASYFDFNRSLSNFTFYSRECYNYELEFYIDSQGGVIVEDDYYSFKGGEVNFRRPGQIVAGVPRYKGYIICFTLTNGTVFNNDYLLGDQTTKEQNVSNKLLDSLPTKICPLKEKEVKELFLNIVQLNGSTTELDKLKTKQYLINLLILLFESIEGKKEKMINNKIYHARNYIESNFLEDISILELVNKSGLSKQYFHKEFKELTGKSPNEMIIFLRMQQAKTLLIMSDQKISEVALSCGYFDTVYFSYLFKRTFGMSPSQFRNTKK